MDENIKKIISKQRIEEIYNILHCEEKINYVMVKGEALSIAAYGATGKRKMGDIDILVKKEELPVLDKRLRENGFKQKNLTECHICLLLHILIKFLHI